MLKAIHAQEDLAAAQRKATEIVARLHSMRLGKAAELVETAVPETLAYYAFPEGALAPHPDQQSARAHHARDSPSDPRGRGLP